MFLNNKSIIKTFLTSNSWLQLKYKSVIHNIAFSLLSHLNQEKNMHRSSIVYTWKWSKYVGGFWPERTQGDF